MNLPATAEGAETPRPGSYCQVGDGSHWLHFPGLGVWTGWMPGEDGCWELSEAEFERLYGSDWREDRSGR